jgi:hypothetical protein
MVKTQPTVAPGGRFPKQAFTVLDDRVVCPAGRSAAITVHADGSGTAAFGAQCTACPLRARCTTSPAGRTISIHRHEDRLGAARARERDPAWQADYQVNRPKVERKLSHMVRRWHGGRRARVRGLRRVAQDWQLLGAAHNVARMAVLGVHTTSRGWQPAPT